MSDFMISIEAEELKWQYDQLNQAIIKGPFPSENSILRVSFFQFFKYSISHFQESSLFIGKQLSFR